MSRIHVNNNFDQTCLIQETSEKRHFYKMYFKLNFNIDI